MSEEEEIITIYDGIDVSECEYFDGFCEKYDTSCDEGGNCIYKQLKRLQEENEKLKSINQNYKDRYCELYENADQLTNKTYKYKNALEEIRENILSRYSIDKNKTIIASPLEDLWCIKKLIDEVLNE